MAGEPDALIGSVIDGRYEVRAQLGHGGMGRLYRAWQASVSREVAIKLIDRSLVADPMAVTRFQREAELASKLSHPNTVSVFDFGRTADGQLYIAMELIAGKTLAAALREQGPFAVSRIVRIGIQLCNALETAHRLGIVHRDLKLDNVMVLERDLVKILDFGLAKRVDDLRGTAVGLVVGTPRYIAPEVSTSGIATLASDMYAVGMILTELAIGGALWGGDSLGQLLAKKLDPAPAIQQVPAGLRAVTSRLLDVSPERRPTATEAHELLMRLARGEVIDELGAARGAARPSVPTIRDRPVVRARTRRRWVIAGAIGGAAIASVIAVLATREHDRKHPETLAAPPDEAVPVRGTADVGSDPAPAAQDDPWSGPFPVEPAPTPRRAQLTGDCEWCVRSDDHDTVVIEVRTLRRGGAVRIAGHKLGAPPLDVTVKRSTIPLDVVLEVAGTTARQRIVPDHDQVVDLAPE